MCRDNVQKREILGEITAIVLQCTSSERATDGPSDRGGGLWKSVTYYGAEPLSDMKQRVVDNWEMINSLSRKRFGETPLAEEAALFAMNCLVDGDGRRLQGYGGKAPFAAFLASVTWRLLEDFSRKRYGRRRPPQWIQNLGGIWLRLFMLLCFERVSIEEAVQIAGQERTSSHGEEPEDVAWKIREQVTDCGSHQGFEVSLDGGERETAHSAEAAAPPVSAEEKERKELFTRIFTALTDVDQGVVEKNLAALSSLSITLDPEEKLLLRLCYREGLNVARAGRMLGLNRHQAHGRLRRLLARIRKELEQAGLDRELIELLRQ